MSFKNKIVIVTGASSGIGAACAIAFAEQGANVVLVGRNNEKLQRVTEKCNKSGKKHLSIIANITDEEAARRVVNDTVKKFTKIDILVNNAGILGGSTILDADFMKSYDAVINTNLRAAVYMTHLAAPHLIKTKGNIINISSVAGKVFVPYGLGYCSSKAALDHFTRGVAAELAPHGVRVNTVSPGPVKTDIVANAGFDMTNDEFKKMIPKTRVSEPVEIADLVLFLVSDKSVAITGSDFVSDNGLLLKR